VRKNFTDWKSAKQLLQSAVVEQLHRRTRAALGQLQRTQFQDAERVTGDSFEFVVRLEKCQHLAFLPRDLMHPRYHRVQQSRRQVLERVPQQDAVEMVFRIVHRLPQKKIDAAGIGMIAGAFGAERLVQDL
jgi:hypothetical protein